MHPVLAELVAVFAPPACVVCGHPVYVRTDRPAPPGPTVRPCASAGLPTLDELL